MSDKEQEKDVVKAQISQIGARIADRRLENGLSQDKLSELTQLSANHISRIETGSKIMRIDTMIQICKVLDLDYTYLITGNQINVDAEEIVTLFRQLNPSQYEAVMAVLHSYGEKKEVLLC